MTDQQGEWAIVTLGEVCRFQGGTQPPKNTFKFRPETGYVRLLQIRDFENDDYATYVSQEYNLRLVSEDDILLARYGASVGKILRGKRGAINVALMKAEPLEGKISKSLLFYFLQRQHVQRYLKGLGGRSAQAGFNQGDLNRIELTLPPLPEQERICKLLDLVCELRQSCSKDARLEVERKAALAEHLFVNGDKSTVLGELGTIRYGLGQPPQLDPSGIPMIRATDIKRGRILYDNALRVSPSAIPNSRNPYLSKGDILVVRSGAYTGDAAMYDGRWQRAIAGYDLVLSVNSRKADPTFITHYLLSEHAQRYFRSQRDRAAQAHINAQQLAALAVPLPTVAAQNEIGTVLSASQRRVEALQAEANILAECFETLLEELFSRGLRLPTSDEDDK